ncbi:hypothetical protein ANANG_G00024810 [Anguilla anguilla]|uniref:Uncharacterized protein n=1 Tax=Anguilla anguilla TaxID=7936 RepID=A0A9D3N2Y6_ANGAN|nr:hypothetical protein ANANG_G00024810 [Anguilla anguilla]
MARTFLRIVKHLGILLDARYPWQNVSHISAVLVQPSPHPWRRHAASRGSRDDVPLLSSGCHPGPDGI